MRFIIKVASLGCVSMVAGGFAFADSFTINLINDSNYELNVCAQEQGKYKAGDQDACSFYADATSVASVGTQSTETITVDTSKIFFSCDITPITIIDLSKENLAGQCEDQLKYWETYCPSANFSCTDDNGFTATLQ